MSAELKRAHRAEEAAAGRVIPAWLFWMIYAMPFLAAFIARVVDRVADNLPLLVSALLIGSPCTAVYIMLARYRRRTIF